MKNRIIAAAAFGLAGMAEAAPPAALAPALKTSLAAASRLALKGIRNRAYSLEEVRANAQANVARARALVARRQVAASGLRERVLEETAEFLRDLGGEVDRLAAQSRNGDELAARLESLASPIGPRDAGLAAGRLAPTEPNIEGPFYRPDAPWGTDLVPAGVTGIATRVSGRVLDVDGRPIPGAVVDVWQADPSGAYDIDDPKDRVNPAVPYRFRARMKADAAGRYAFTTVLPGNYEIGEGKWRTRHIHFKASAPGFAGLTTQLYFEGDPYNAVDAWWRQSTTIPLAAGAGTFDIVLPHS